MQEVDQLTQTLSSWYRKNDLAECRIFQYQGGRGLAIMYIPLRGRDYDGYCAVHEALVGTRRERGIHDRVAMHVC